MKSLVESLFDDDLATKGVCFGEVVELEEWECASPDDVTMLEVVMNSNFKDWRTGEYKKIVEEIKKPQWKSFLEPFKSYYSNIKNFVDNDEKYWWNICFYYFTWVVMCCKNIKEIKEKLTKFIDASRNSETEVSRHRINEPIEPIKKVEVIPLEGLGDMKGMPRLVVVKFKTENKDVVVYMKLKKKE